MKFCLIEFCLDPGQRVDLNIIDKVGLKDGRQKAKKKKSQSLIARSLLLFLFLFLLEKFPLVLPLSVAPAAV